MTAHVEAYIDFPEEDISPDTMQQLTAGLDGAAEALNRLLATADEDASSVRGFVLPLSERLMWVNPVS